MKKFTVFILTIFTVATLFAAALPSLDGRAVVADSGTMPRGLFARTVGYLPGDSVTVTNPESGKTTDVLVLGAIDPSEGVAVLLSPEAAEALSIDPGANVQVKLTKRSGSLDENASGSAVLSNDDSSGEIASEENSESETPAAEISEESDDVEIAEEPAVPVEEEPAEPLPVEPSLEISDSEAETVPEESEIMQETAGPVDEAPAESVAETPAETYEKTAEETPAESVDEEPLETVAEAPAEQAEKNSEPVYEEIPAEPVEEIAETPAEESSIEETPAVPSEKVAEAPVEETSAVPEEPSEIEETPVLPEPAENTKTVSGEQLVEVVPLESAAGNENAEPLPVHEEELPALVEDKDENTPLQPVVVKEEKPARKEEPGLETSVAAETEETPAVAVEERFDEEPSAIEYEETPAFVESEPEVVAESPAEAEEKAFEEAPAVAEETPKTEPSKNEKVDDDSFEPIVLVPTDMNPPEPAPEKAAETVKTEPVEVAKSEPEPVEPKAAEASKPVVTNSWKNYIVPSHKNLVKGRYYIQIASLSKEENIKNMIDKYSSKYPMVLIQSTNGKSYQVMVGPLSIDEYGSVLERMKAYGYKDAFVKHIK